MKPSAMFRVLLTVGLCLHVLQPADGQTSGRHLMQKPALAPVAAPTSTMSGTPLPAGTYTVGTGGYFPTLDSAFSRLTGGGILGSVTLSLTDTLYVASPSKKGAFTLEGPVSGSGPTARITIRPADNKSVTIQGNGEGTVFIHNVSYLTLDGVSLQGSTRLNVHALYDTTGKRWNDGIDIIGNSDFVNVQNLTVMSDDIKRASGAVSLYADSLGVPDSCLVTGVFVRSATFGIYHSGYVPGSTIVIRPKGNIIRNNHIGSPTDSLIAWGVEDEASDGTLIENNHVENLRLIWLSGGTAYESGIQTYFGSRTVIRNNLVHNISTTIPLSSRIGILASGDFNEAGNYVWIYDNMVYDMRTGTSSPGGGLNITGIRAWYQNGLLVDFNSVHLAPAAEGAQGVNSAAVWTGNTTQVPTFRNNIMVNTRNDPGSVALRVESSPWGSNNNDLYVDPAGNGYVAYGPQGYYKSLSDWQKLGSDSKSVSVLPAFRDLPYLHIDSTKASSKLLDGHGMPGSGITTDFDGQLRDASTPDIGADEFKILPGERLTVPAPYATIQGAIDAARYGDTVLVSEGTYKENITYRGKGITVASYYLIDGDTTHIAKTTIDGSSPHNPDTASVVSFVSGEDTMSVLCGFTITGGKGTKLARWNSLEGGGVLCYMSGARLVRNTITGNVLYDNLDRYGLFGAGVSADGSGSEVLLMERNTLTNNSGSTGVHSISGGGVGILSMNAILRHNVITANSLVTQTTSLWAAGGGVYAEQGSLVALDNLIAKNTALSPQAAGPYEGSGGGVFVEAMTLDFRNNRVIGNMTQSATSNSAVGGGIVIFAENSSELRDCSLTGNYFALNQAIGGPTTSGGGVDLFNVKALLQNNIIVKNKAARGGGVGIHGTSPGPPALINNTIGFNQATGGGAGGGICSDGIWNPVVVNTIVWADTGAQEIGLLSGSTITVTYSDVAGGFSGTGNIGADPRFATGDTTYNLQTGSPCVGAGIDSIQFGGVWYLAPANDFAGRPRPRPVGRQHSDIGAQEEQVTLDIRAQQNSPLTYYLFQNYPNPFNPATTIRYSLPHKSQVLLAVYNTLGQQVATLVHGQQEAGSYEVKFDGSALASGVYFCKLQAGSYVNTKKLLFLR